MALALAQELRNHGFEQPSNIVLLSPWLDVTMTNPDIAAIDSRDPILNLTSLKNAGVMYARNLDLKNPLVSPLFGSLDHLAAITLFIGTNDVLLADCQKLNGLAKSHGWHLNLLEYQNMVHDWMLLPMPEANRVMDEIVTVLERR